MCYFVYGALYGDIDSDEYKKIEDKYEYKFHNGTKHGVKMSVSDKSDTYRVTDWSCDCGGGLGGKDISNDQVKEIEAIFNDIKQIKGAKHIYLCKTWWGKRNKTEIKLKLSEINISETLANLKENCLYTFEV